MVLSVLLVWLYTVRGGVKAVIGMDIFKTLCMLAAVGLTLILVGKEVGKLDTGYMQLFHFDDVNHPQYFWKQLLGGMFTVIAMTGLDQDMMQRTLACKNVKDSQKNLMVSILLQAVMIALFLLLGVALYQFAGLHGITAKRRRALPGRGLERRPAQDCGHPLPGGPGNGRFPGWGQRPYVPHHLLHHRHSGRKGPEAHVDHSGMAVLMALTIIVFGLLNNTSVIDAVYRLASYTYGPLLGLFTFGLCCKRTVKDRWVPVVAVAAPLLCLVLDLNSVRWFGGYHFSYELLAMNAAFTIIGLLLIVRGSNLPFCQIIRSGTEIEISPCKGD